MQSRIKQMKQRINQEIEEKEGLLADLEKTAPLKLTPLIHHKETLIRIRDYTLKYEGAEMPLFTGLTFQLQRGERIALHGPNGCGKSTLLQMILRKSGAAARPLPLFESGVCETAPGLIVSYISQDTQALKGSVSDYCAHKNLDKSLFCSVLRLLGFDRIQFQKNMENYSEGQKKKALIAASLLTPAHLYIWDEPLNYIDVFSRMQIESLLLEYQPAMLFVEHDARFREKIATKTIHL